MLQLEHVHKSQPLYAQIKSILQDRIQNREYLPGALIPSEFKLTEEFGVSRITIRQALLLLEKEGLVERIQGKGTRVIYPKAIHENLEGIHLFTDVMKNRGIEPGTLYGHIELIYANEEISKVFHIQNNEQLYRLSRIRTGDNVPLAYTICYLSKQFNLPLNDEHYKENLYTVISDFNINRPLHAVDYFSAAIADKDIANMLKINKGDAILLRKRVFKDENEEVLAYIESFYPGERYGCFVQLKD